MLASVSLPAARAGEQSEATFGSQWWTQSANDAKYQEFRDVRRGGFLESFVVRNWSGRNLLNIQGVNALAKDQSTRLTYANGVRFRLDLGYQEIPHTFSNSARWGWLQASPGVFILPDSLQARNQLIPGTYTQRMLDYLKSAPGINLGFSTQISNARARFRPAKGWQLEARGSVRQRDGLKPYATSFGFSTALENPEPLDQTMLDVDVIADYRRAAFTMQASGGVSSFRNDISVLRVDNPKRITPVDGGDGTVQSALDLYPDNKVLRGNVAMSYELPRRSTLTGTLALASGSQDDAFLPFTTNTVLPQSNPDSLPARSLDAKTTQITGDVRLRMQPADKLDGTLRFHYNDYKTDAKELNFIGQAPYEASWQRFIEHPNHLFDATQWQAGVDLDYDLTSRASVGGIAEYRIRERSHREVEKDAETVLGGRLKVSAPHDILLNAAYTRGDRKMDEFLGEEYIGLKQGATSGLYDTPGLLEQPGLRRFDVADRVQDLATAGLMMPLGDRFDVAVNYAFTRNDFKSDTGTDTTLGLDLEELQNVAASATLHVNEELDLLGSFGFGRTRSEQRSRASGAALSYLPDSSWTAKLEDKETFVNTGFEWAPPKKKLSLSGEYEISRTMSSFDLGNGLNNAADLPNTFYRRQDAQVEAAWRWLAGTSIVGRYQWEQFDMIDWAVNNVPLIFPVTGTSNAIFLGDSSRSYTAHRVALVLRHRF
jgi:MtrB/PioB family decaheme-associated outer membrane protein